MEKRWHLPYDTCNTNGDDHKGSCTLAHPCHSASKLFRTFVEYTRDDAREYCAIFLVVTTAWEWWGPSRAGGLARRRCRESSMGQARPMPRRVAPPTWRSLRISQRESELFSL